jgi:hypothetical protein
MKDGTLAIARVSDRMAGKKNAPPPGLTHVPR